MHDTPDSLPFTLFCRGRVASYPLTLFCRGCGGFHACAVETICAVFSIVFSIVPDASIFSIRAISAAFT